MVVKLHNHQARSGQPVFLNKPTVTVRAHCRTDGLVYISTPEHELRPCRKMSLDRGNHQAGYGGPLLRCQNPQPTVKVRRYQMDWCTSVLLNTNYGRAAKCPSMAATTRSWLWWSSPPLPEPAADGEGPPVSDGLVYISTPEHELRCRVPRWRQPPGWLWWSSPPLPEPAADEGPPVSDGPVYISTPEHELLPCRKIALDGGNHQAGYGGPLLRCQNPQPTVKVRRYQMDWFTSVLLNTNYGRAAK